LAENRLSTSLRFPFACLANKKRKVVFVFDRQERQTHANSYTFYLRYIGPLPAGNDVKVDITKSRQRKQ
jgi:hypothetical protein